MPSRGEGRNSIHPAMGKFGKAAMSCVQRQNHIGIEYCAPSLKLARHRHEHGYIAIVLEGGYREAGDAGRVQVGPGHMLIHGAYEAHLDEIGAGGAKVLNLPASCGDLPQTIFSLEDPDEIVRIAERDPEEAAAAALMMVGCGPPAETDWPDQLANVLRTCAPFRLDDWAHANGLAPATVSRGFRRAYGVSPARYRVECRARRAMKLIVSSNARLAHVALYTGFADQPHMTREISALTGKPPLALRY